MAASALCAEVLHFINISSDIEFALSKNKDFFGHTSIVLKFEGIPVFTINYGQDGGYFDFLGSNVSHFDRLPGPSHQVLGAFLQSSAVVGALLLPGCDLRVNGFDISMVDVLDRIAKFAINSPAKKSFIKNLIVKIANIKKNECSVPNNNCRNFVKQATIIIKAALERYHHRSLSNNNRPALKDVRKQDRRKIGVAVLGGGVAVLVGAVAGLGLLAALATKSSDEEE